jgi:hypothetical protein
MGDINLQLPAPYEAVAVAALNLVGKIIEGQPPEVKAQLWQCYIEDMKNWREFGMTIWKALGLIK